MKSLVVLSCLSLVLLLPQAFAMGKKPEKNTLTFHLEGAEIDNPKMIFPLQMGNQKRFFQRTPLVTLKEITSFKHFPTEDGTFGATFTFAPAAANRIAALTTQHQKKWIVGMLNGKAADAVFVDQPVRDGKLVIWRGISLQEIIRFEYAMPLTGESRNEWQERLKEHEKARKEAQKAAKEKSRRRAQ